MKILSLPVIISFVLAISIIGASKSTGANDDILLGITWEDSLLVSFDPNTGNIIEVHAQLNPNESFRGLVYDSNHNLLYALSQVALNLYSIDPLTLEILHVGNLRIPYGDTDTGGITYDPSKDIFYITLSEVSSGSSDLLTVNVDNASVSRVGTIKNGYFFSPSFNENDGRIYGFALYGSGSWDSPYKSSVVSINPNNMSMTTLFETPYHTILGLAKKPGEKIFYSWVNWTSHFYCEINPDAGKIISLGNSAPVGVASDAMIFRDFYVGSGSILPREEKPVSFDFVGHATEVWDPDNFFNSSIAVGDIFSGHFTYDINAIYLHTTDQLPYGISIEIGDHIFSLSEIEVGVENNYYNFYSDNSSDSFYLSSGNQAEAYESISFSMTLTDHSSASLSNNIFLPKKFDLSSWDENEVYLFTEDILEDSPGFSVRGVIDSVISDVDSDDDGIPDHSDNCPDDPLKIDPGICGCGVIDIEGDDDGDGTLDCNDACPKDPEKIEAGICGCGVPDIDSDKDGTMDCIDKCPHDPGKSRPGVCGCGIADIDSDDDGTIDCNDLCPEDPQKNEPGICGCGIADIDSDGDGTADCNDENDDNDGLPDTEEKGPNGNDSNYDGNDDGMADCLQDNVVSFHSWDKQNYLTIKSSAGTIVSSLRVLESPFSENVPEDIGFLYGLFEFTIEGISVGGNVEVILHLPVEAFFNTYYKYGPTPDNTTSHWYEFLYNGRTGAVISDNVITLHLTDGMRGDDDIAVNGMISDTSGPGISLNSGGSGSGGCFIINMQALN